MDGEIDPAALAALVGAGDAGDAGDQADEADETPGSDGSDESDENHGSDDGTDDDLRIVDIRDRRAFDRGHVPGSESIPFPELTSRVAELSGADRIVTVCPHGIASRQAAQLIGSYAGTAEARVESLRGGLEAWERDVGELEATATGSDDAGADGGPPGEGADEGPEAPF